MSMSASVRPKDLLIDHFDRLPDSFLLLVFNKISDVKALGCYCVISHRFHSLVPQVEKVDVCIDCILSDDDSSLSSSSSSSSDKSRNPFFNLFCFVFFDTIVKLFQFLSQFLGGPKRPVFSRSSSSSSSLFLAEDSEVDQGGVTHHSPTQVFKNFNKVRFLRIELPSGELGIEDGVFGGLLQECE